MLMMITIMPNDGAHYTVAPPGPHTPVGPQGRPRESNAGEAGARGTPRDLSVTYCTTRESATPTRPGPSADRADGPCRPTQLQKVTT